MRGSLPSPGDNPVRRDICFGDTSGDGSDCNLVLTNQVYDENTNTTVDKETRYKTTSMVVACNTREGGVFYLYQLQNTPCVEPRKNTLYCAGIPYN